MYDVHIIVMMMEVIQKRASVSIQFHVRFICFRLRCPDKNLFRVVWMGWEHQS